MGLSLAETDPSQAAAASITVFMMLIEFWGESDTRCVSAADGRKVVVICADGLLPCMSISMSIVDALGRVT